MKTHFVIHSSYIHLGKAKSFLESLDLEAIQAPESRKLTAGKLELWAILDKGREYRAVGIKPEHVGSNSPGRNTHLGFLGAASMWCTHKDNRNGGLDDVFVQRPVLACM